MTLRLGPLTTVESIDLVRQAGGGGFDEEEAAEIAERTGGNPFFIIETTGMLLPEEPAVRHRRAASRPRCRPSSRRGSTPFPSGSAS